jgi:hypothetical protein
MQLEYNSERKHPQSIFYRGEVWNYYDMGLTRVVYANEDKTRVVKFLIDEFGINHNRIESDIYLNANDKSELAKTVLLEDGFIVEQEFVLPIKFSDKELTLKQIQFAGKCRDEVGWDSEGNLKCFDLSEYKQW